MINKPTTPAQALQNAIHAAESAKQANVGATTLSMERAENYTRLGELWLGIAEEMRVQKKTGGYGPA